MPHGCIDPPIACSSSRASIGRSRGCRCRVRRPRRAQGMPRRRRDRPRRLRAPKCENDERKPWPVAGRRIRRARAARAGRFRRDARRVNPGKISAPGSSLVRSGRASSSTRCACFDSGTRCGTRIFMRAAGMRQVSPSRRSRTRSRSASRSALAVKNQPVEREPRVRFGGNLGERLEQRRHSESGIVARCCTGGRASAAPSARTGRASCGR